MNAARDWTTLSLDPSGRSLVEASAGTGKTWTIGVLFLRLILEQGLSPRQIVVTTFTNAAAAELRERLRARLVWALEWAEAGQGRDGATTQADALWLLSRWNTEEQVRRRDRSALLTALAEFDRAPVTTLHALCSRILSEHPFAAGALFRGRTAVDARHVVKRLAQDLWRILSQSPDSDPMVIAYRDSGVRRQDLAKYVEALVRPEVHVPLADLAPFHAALESLGDLTAWSNRIQGILERDDVFLKASPLKNQWVRVLKALEDPRKLPEAIRYASGLEMAPDFKGIKASAKSFPEVLWLAEQGQIVANAMKEMDPIWVEDLKFAPQSSFLLLVKEWATSRMRAYLDAGNQSTFDDIIGSVREALEGAEGRALADALHEAWPAALVDEFQDTDPTQFEVLDAIYRNAGGGHRGRLIMIGDDKQAIYRFRGGDIHAYERAKQDVAECDRLTLGVNHRSSAGYVAAINAFYGKIGESLGPAGRGSSTRYVPVSPSDQHASKKLLDHSGAEVAKPLIVHLLKDEPTRARALTSCADQIAILLSESGHRIGDRALEPSDIAVLVPSNADLRRLSAMLKRRGVPSVLRSSDRSVFQSEVAKELLLILAAAADPQDPKTVRAALGTRLWGLKLPDLQALVLDPSRWTGLSRHFHAMGERLREIGPQSVVDDLIDHVAGRLIETVEGERLLTDLRHLSELLQEAFATLQGTQSLLAWYTRELDAGSESQITEADAVAMRLESDSQRVQLMTLHSSKGLEFPIVFLPLMWAHGAFPAKAAQLYVNPTSGRRELVISEGKRKEAVKAEELEERYRVLYVALTRAKYACHLFMVHPQAEMKMDVPLNERASTFLAPGEADAAAFERVEIRTGWRCVDGVQYRSAESMLSPGPARPLPSIPPGPMPMRHSYTTLASGKYTGGGEEDFSADDEALEEESEIAEAVLAELDTPISRTEHPALDALDLVKGAEFGNAVHAIFENRRVGIPLPDQLDLIQKCLAEHGVRVPEESTQQFQSELASRLQAALDTPLGGAGGPRLAALGVGDMRAELEFNFALDKVSIHRLRQRCAELGEPDLVPRKTRTISGLMNGKVDLIFRDGSAFHVLDYKGNRIARGEKPALEHYSPESLDKVMQDVGYRFQALLYVIAVERYLKERLGDNYRRHLHLGDCWYVFIRATGLDLPDGRAAGVWRYRFPDPLLDAVQEVFAAEPTKELA